MFDDGAGGQIEDDFEDLYEITLTAPGLTIVLDSFTVDCDLHLLTPEPVEAIDGAYTASNEGPEVIDLPALGAGTYLIGVSIFDAEGTASDSTRYVLTVTGALEEEDNGGGEPYEGPTGYRVFRSQSADPVNTGLEIAHVDAGASKANATSYLDEDLPNGTYHYAVTAVYGGINSAPSNEEEAAASGAGSNRDPVVLEAIPDMTLLVGAEPFKEDLRRIFEDPDEDPLVFQASSSDPAVVAAGIVENVLSITALEVGFEEVTVSADDGTGGRALVVFKVNVPTGVSSDTGPVPGTTVLHPNYPNPFRSQTTFTFDLATPSAVLLEVYSLLGQRVTQLVDGRRPSGRHQATWDGRDDKGGLLPAGIYVCRMTAEGIVQTRTLVVVR